MWTTSLLTIVLVFPLLWAAPLDIAGGVKDDNDGMHSHDENVTRRGKFFSHNQFDVGNINISGSVAGDVVSIGHEVKIDVHGTHDHHHHEDDTVIECKEGLNVLFKSIDSNKNGVMDAKEFLRVCHQHKIQISESLAVRILTLPDKTVGLNLAKFCELLKDCPSTNSADLIHFLLQLYDKGSFDECQFKTCGELCETGVCDGHGFCVDPLENPCVQHGCRGKSCGDQCLSGDIVGSCDIDGACDFDIDRAINSCDKRDNFCGDKSCGLKCSNDEKCVEDDSIQCFRAPCCPRFSCSAPDLCAGKRCGEQCDSSLGLLQVVRYCQPDGSCGTNARPSCTGPVLPGGFFHLDVNDMKATSAAAAAVSTLAGVTGGSNPVSPCGKNIDLVGVEKAEMQVVAGTNYKLTLRLATHTGDDCTTRVEKVCEDIFVWEKLPFMCPGDGPCHEVIQQENIKCDILVNTGKMDKTIEDRRAKGYGLVSQILAILAEVPLGSFDECQFKTCGELCETGVCDGHGFCVDPLENPCVQHGCGGKSCGDQCLSGDIVGSCDIDGACDFDIDRAINSCDKQDTPCTEPFAVLGPCKARLPRWSYNQETGICRPFLYGGCQGNNNNFDSEEECAATCQKSDTPCTEPFAVAGPCKAGLPRWSYNQETRICRHFLFGGCQGNNNNFDSEEECAATCQKSAPKQEGESCGSCLCPPTNTAGDCAEGLICERDEMLPDAPGICTRPGLVTQVKFNLFTGLTEEEEAVHFDGKTVTLSPSTKFDPGKPIKIVIHGWEESSLVLGEVVQSVIFPVDYPRSFNSRYKNTGLDYTVLGVYWVPFAGWQLPLLSSASSDAANTLALLLSALARDHNISSKQLHFIGFSMGTVITSKTAKKIQEMGMKPISRGTLLDPCFTDQAAIISKSDGDFLEAIHTSSQGHCSEPPLAHVDFYVNGGDAQICGSSPCTCPDDSSVCDSCYWGKSRCLDDLGLPDWLANHFRAPTLYMESIGAPEAFTSWKCSMTYQQFVDNGRRCAKDAGSDTVAMGEHSVDGGRPEDGLYFILTTGEPPFGRY